MGSDESHFNVSLNVRAKVTRQCPQTTVIVRDKVTRQCPQTTIIEGQSDKTVSTDHNNCEGQSDKTVSTDHNNCEGQSHKTVSTDHNNCGRWSTASSVFRRVGLRGRSLTLSPSLISLTVSVDVKQHVYHYYDSNALGVICAGISIGRVREKRGL